jgi:hypothetical protein
LVVARKGGIIGTMHFEIVCPDGHVRHFPYTNFGDAEFDAGLIDKSGRCRFYATPNELEAKLPVCPGGAHTVRPVAVTPGAA